MTDIKSQAFGMELEFTGITRRKAAQTIAQVINGNAKYDYEGGVYHKCTVIAADGRKWTIMSDSSIDTDGGEECEFVTPKCTYDDIETVQECIRALRRAKAKVNSSCGIHIHIDGANHTAQSLKNLAFTFYAKQSLIYRAVKTQQCRLGHFCKPIDDTLINNIKSIRNIDDTSLQNTWYVTYTDRRHTQRDHYHGSRYHALNLHSLWYRGTVEFRLFEATLHAGEVRAYINLCLAMSAAAINAKRTSADVLDNGNDKYAMRCWLLRLGFIGKEWETVREHLLKNLTGNSAWRNDPNTYESYRLQQEARRVG